MARTCTRCRTKSLPRQRKCGACGHALPKKRQPKHKAALEVTYEEYVSRFGELCGICGTGSTTTRRLDRDHWHNGPLAGQPRGLLHARCNRALPSWVTVEWLEKAAAYLGRAA